MYVPGAQSVSAADPTGQNLPAIHVMQSFTLDITASDVSIRVPPGHGLQKRSSATSVDVDKMRQKRAFELLLAHSGAALADAQ